MKNILQGCQMTTVVNKTRLNHRKVKLNHPLEFVGYCNSKMYVDNADIGITDDGQELTFEYCISSVKELHDIEYDSENIDEDEGTVFGIINLTAENLRQVLDAIKKHPQNDDLDQDAIKQFHSDYKVLIALNRQHAKDLGLDRSPAESDSIVETANTDDLQDKKPLILRKRKAVKLI